MATASLPMTAARAGSAPAGPRSAVTFSLLGLAALLLLWHALRYDFITDDAYISFVYARNLAEHGELTFNLGDYVEGYSNFSWTVLLAGLLKLGVAPELGARVLGLGSGVAALGLAFLLTERALRRGSPWASLPPLLLALSSGFACWSSGGLETQLFTALCLAALHRFAVAVAPARPYPARRRSFAALGLLLALSALTRPEGLLLTAVLGVAVLGWVARPLGAWRSPLPRGLALRLGCYAGGAFAVLWLPWFAWRLWYYGWPFPNTYYVKAHGPWRPPELAVEMWHNGGYYLLTWLEQTGLLWCAPVPLLGLLVVRTGSRRFAVTAPMLGFAVAYLGYAASVGGDFMGLHRFIMPVFAIAAIGLTLGLQGLLQQIGVTSSANPWARAVAVALPLALVLGFASKQAALTQRSLRWGNFAADRGIDTPAYLIAYTEDRAALGRALRGCVRPDDFSIVGGAGAQPYFGRLRAIDVFGLVSAQIAHREPRIRARAGHTKFASDALLAEADPTFVFSCYALHATANPPSLPCAQPWLGRGFERVTLHVPALRQSGTYYTFLARQRRAFRCPGLVR